jgi:hypothetical protein
MSLQKTNIKPHNTSSSAVANQTHAAEKKDSSVDEKTQSSAESIISQKTISTASGSSGLPPLGAADMPSKNHSQIFKPIIQTKLSVSNPTDEYEKEADDVANQVMTMPEKNIPKFAPITTNNPVPIIRRKEEEESNIQPFSIFRKSEDNAPPAPSWIETRLNESKGFGNPLPDDTKANMENRFGADFSSVKIHKGSNAVQMNKELNAQAFTHGSDIYFNSGKFDTESNSGKHLLSHELAHVLQQNNYKTPSIVNRAPQPTATPDEKSSPFDISVTTTLSGMVLSFPPAFKYKPGATRPQAISYMLQRLLGDQFTDSISITVNKQLAGKDYSRNGIINYIATTEEPIGQMNIESLVAKEILGLLRHLKLTIYLQEEQIRILELGAVTKTSFGQIRAMLNYKWYTQYIFDREMAYHEKLLEQYKYMLEDGQFSEEEKKQTMNSVVAALRVNADVVEKIRLDTALANTEESWIGYFAIWPSENPKKQKLETPPELAREEIAATFMPYMHTQPYLFKNASKPGNEGHKARVTLLGNFGRFLGRAIIAYERANERLSDSYPRATDSPFSSTLSVYPPVGNFPEVIAGTDYRFSMNIHFKDVFDAFGFYVYIWERVELPPRNPKNPMEPVDVSKLKSETPTIEEVKAARYGRDERYGKEDMERYGQNDLDRVRKAIGIMPGLGASDIITANNIMRYAGTGIKLGIDRLTMPRSDKLVVFPKTGEFIVRCQASVILKGKEEVVRPPSVAFLQFFVKDPKVMAEEQLKRSVSTEESAKKRITVINALLSSPFGVPNKDELQAELKELKAMVSTPDENLVTRKKDIEESISAIEKRQEELKKEITRLEDLPPSADKEAQLKKARGALATAEFTDKYKLSSFKRQLKEVKRILEIREGRQKEHPGKRNLLKANFVSDLGYGMPLSLEMVDYGKSEADGEYSVYISDITSSKGGDATGKGKDKKEAIRNGMKILLESSSEYGRGIVSVLIDGEPSSIPIQASGGRLMSEFIGNATMIVSIAAIAAAPFTGGASLYVLIPVGVIGAVPSVYRLYNKFDSHTLYLTDIDTLTDIVNIVGAFLGIAQVGIGIRAATAATMVSRLRLVKIERVLMVMGLGNDASNVLLMSAGIVEQLEALKELPEGERASRMFQIFGQAFLQFGIMAGGQMAAKYKLSKEVEASAKRQAPAEPPITSPEHLFNKLGKGVEQIPHVAPPAGVKAEPHSTYRPEVKITSAEHAYTLYNEALSGAKGKEAGIYYNPSTGEYKVRIGDEHGVNGPSEQGYHAVLHYHPNPNNVLTFRLPAPADFVGLIMRYVKEHKTVREFVEFEIPGVGRGRTEFGIEGGQKEPFYVKIFLPDGTQQTVRFQHDGAYSVYWGSRTVYLEPGTPEYKRMISDISEYLRKRPSTEYLPEERANNKTMFGVKGKGGSEESPAGGTKKPETIEEPKKSNPDTTEELPKTSEASIPNSTAPEQKPLKLKWDDPNITIDQVWEVYKAENPKTGYKGPKDPKFVKKFKKGYRVNPETGYMKKPAIDESLLPDISARFKTTETETANYKYIKTAGELGEPGQVKTHRSPAEQKKVSAGKGDDAGHRIGNRFGAPGGGENLSLQNWKANEYGTFKNLENLWTEKLQDGVRIIAEVEDVFVKGESRPFERKVKWEEIRPDGSKESFEATFGNFHTAESRKAAGIKTVDLGQDASVTSMTQWKKK